MDEVAEVPENQLQSESKEPIRTKSGRIVRPIQRYTIETMLAETEVSAHTIEGEIFCLQAMFPIDTIEQDPLLAYKAQADPDTMYLHQAMKQPDKGEFIESMSKEINQQMKVKAYSVIKRSKVPEGATILPAVWQLRRKRNSKTGEIKKYKARLNIDGSRMKKGIHYDQTYAPVATWQSIRLVLTMAAVHGWHTKQLDYVLAFPQAPVERDLYMEIPKGVEIENIDSSNTKEYVLKIHKNLYGQKQAGRVWYQYLANKLVKEVGFTPSKIDECVFYKGSVMYVLYTDDSILAGPDENEIKQVIKDIKKAKLDITEEGDLQDFLGVNIERKEDGSVHLTQPNLIKQIIKDLRLEDDKVKTKTLPAPCSKILSAHSESEDFDNSYNYRSVIGKLNYLEKCTRSDIAYATHQCARFTANPKKEHGEAARWLGRYLKGTMDKGTILKPNMRKDLEVFVDADFSGNWDPKESHNADTARSRHGYIIMYKGCPITWKSQMQTEIALSSTESEYTGLSYALREAIPIMEILKEMKNNGYDIKSTVPKVHCKVFEDNSGALEIASVHKYRPRTKHLNVKLHHFRDYVVRGEISIRKIESQKQLADYLTKPLNETDLIRLRKKVMGW